MTPTAMVFAPAQLHEEGAESVVATRADSE